VGDAHRPGGQRVLRRLTPLVAVALIVGGCSSEAARRGATTADSTTPSTISATTTIPQTTVATTVPATTTLPATTTTTTAPPDPLVVLVTNDDGIGNAGIDTLVRALEQLPGVEIVLVAPATDQSGTGDRTTPGGVIAAPALTVSGFEGVAVNGLPADAVTYALDQLGVEPDVVVSGVNTGLNLGPNYLVSGTIGAARVAARRGYPAIAVSVGGVETFDYGTAARIAVEEIAARRDQLSPGSNTSGVVVALNVPTCTAGAVRGIVDVPRAPQTQADPAPDCTSMATGPTDDHAAVAIGFVARSTSPADA
jgi:5'-nucleotidase